MRLRRRGVQRRELRVLWLALDDSAPHPYLVSSLRKAGMAVRDLHWAMSENGQRSFGRYVEFGDRTGHEHPPNNRNAEPCAAENSSGLSCLLLPAEPAAQQSRQPSAVSELGVVRRF